MGILIELSVEAGDWPGEDELRVVAEAAIGAAGTELDAGGSEPPRFTGEDQAEVSILFTNNAHIRCLNRDYRCKDKPTNVLSFPQPPGPHGGPLLGDIILAFETVRDEAALAGKALKEHMAHLIVHGFLHLIGYDHESDEEAEEMEALERAALARIGIPDPYPAAQDI